MLMIRNKKILIVANHDFFSTYGGGQVYVKNIVDEMIDQGMNLVVLSFSEQKNDDGIMSKEYKGITVYSLSPRNHILLKEWIASIQPDIIHAHSMKGLLATIGRELNIPCVVTAHHGGITCPAGTLLNYRDEICRIPVSFDHCLPCVLRNIRGGLLAYPLVKRIPFGCMLKTGRCLQKLPFIYFITPIGMSALHFEKKQEEWSAVIQNAAKVIAPSDAIADAMVRNGLDRNKIHLLPHGIPLPKHTTPRAVVDIAQHVVRFFYVGRICYVKGIHVLLKAFTGLDSSKCELHLIGDIQGRYPQKLIKEYKRYSTVFFHGKIHPDEVSDRIKQYDVSVHPAIYLEVFGLNIAESLWEGKPVIATRCGGAEMQLVEGENGWLVNPNNVVELRQAMQWVMEHPGEVSEMSRKAPETVKHIRDHVQALCEIYSS